VDRVASRISPTSATTVGSERRGGRSVHCCPRKAGGCSVASTCAASRESEARLPLGYVRAVTWGLMAARWDGDDRGQGIGDAAQLVSGARELVAAFRAPAWVAEQPEFHLLPRIEAWCERDGRLALAGAHTNDADAYVLDLEWRDATGSVGAARAAVFSLIGSFAESATYVRQRRVEIDGGTSAMELQFQVGTGELAPDARFVPHGHVVLINVAAVL
jgi:hypothetical protein